MDLELIATRLAERAATIEAVTGYPNVPHSVSEPAFVVVDLEVVDVGYCVERIRASCGLLVQRSDDDASARALYAYARRGGDTSVPDVLEAEPTLGGACTDLTVVSRRVPRVFPLRGTEYLAVEFVVEIDGPAE